MVHHFEGNASRTSFSSSRAIWRQTACPCSFPGNENACVEILQDCGWHVSLPEMETDPSSETGTSWESARGIFCFFSAMVTFFLEKVTFFSEVTFSWVNGIWTSCPSANGNENVCDLWGMATAACRESRRLLQCSHVPSAQFLHI